MKCPACKQKVNQTDMYCSYCGAILPKKNDNQKNKISLFIGLTLLFILIFIKMIGIQKNMIFVASVTESNMTAIIVIWTFLIILLLGAYVFLLDRFLQLGWFQKNIAKTQPTPITKPTQPIQEATLPIGTSKQTKIIIVVLSIFVILMSPFLFFALFSFIVGPFIEGWVAASSGGTPTGSFQSIGLGIVLMMALFYGILVSLLIYFASKERRHKKKK